MALFKLCWKSLGDASPKADGVDFGKIISDIWMVCIAHIGIEALSGEILMHNSYHFDVKSLDDSEPMKNE